MDIKKFSPRFWNEVKKDYEAGMSQVELRKKYDLKKGTLAMKIMRGGWRLSQEQTASISDFKNSFVELSKNFDNASSQQKEEIVERVRTIIQDNLIIKNNRSLLKVFQGRIGELLDAGAYNTPNEIKLGVSTLKDAEFIVNPKVPKIDVKQQNQTQINKIERIIIDPAKNDD